MKGLKKLFRGSKSYFIEEEDNDEDSFEISSPVNVEHKVNVSKELEWEGQNPLALFQLQEKLGEGSFGSVWKVIPQQNDGNYALAIKQIKVKDEEYAEIQKEIDILKKCKSPYIVSYYGVFRLEYMLWILMDYCALGSVVDIMEKMERTLSENESAWVIKCSLFGLSYLHKMNIVHRDVKGGNILITDKGEVKIADFGVSEKLENTLAEIAGTPLWMAPEVCSRSKYNHKADVWSLGITLIEILDGAPPLAELNPYIAMQRIPRNDPPTFQNPSEYSKEANDWLSKCLIKDYTKRWDTQQLFEHPFTKNADKESFKNIIETLDKNKNKKVDISELQFISSSDPTISSKSTGSDDAGGVINSGDGTVVEHGTIRENSGTVVEYGTVIENSGTVVQKAGETKAPFLKNFSSGTVDSGTVIEKTGSYIERDGASKAPFLQNISSGTVIEKTIEQGPSKAPFLQNISSGTVIEKDIEQGPSKAPFLQNISSETVITGKNVVLEKLVDGKSEDVIVKSVKVIERKPRSANLAKLAVVLQRTTSNQSLKKEASGISAWQKRTLQKKNAMKKIQVNSTHPQPKNSPLTEKKQNIKFEKKLENEETDKNANEKNEKTEKIANEKNEKTENNDNSPSLTTMILTATTIALCSFALGFFYRFMTIK